MSTKNCRPRLTLARLEMSCHRQFLTRQEPSGGPPGCVFTGTKGTLHLGRGVLKSDPEHLAADPHAPGDVQLPRSPGHHRNWLDCIKTRERPIADVEVGARSVTVCHLGNLAYWYRRRLKWDPQQWRFVDDAEADTWLDRDRRDPWQLPAVG